MVTSPRFTHRNVRMLWLAVAMLAACAFVLLAYLSWSSYRSTWAEAQSTVSTQAELIESRFDATLRRLEASMTELATAVPPSALITSGAPDPVLRRQLESRLENHRRLFPELAGFRLIDARGQIRYLAGGGDYANVADRGYFIQARAALKGGLVFSEVLHSRVAGRSVLVVARALVGEHGEFIGVLSAAIELGYFDEIFRRMQPAPGGALLIRRCDSHALILRRPPVPEEVNRSLTEGHPVHQKIAAGERMGVLEFAAQTDGIRRIYAFRVLERYPFYVVSGLSEADTMAAWRDRILVVAGLGGILLLALSAVLSILYRVQGELRQISHALGKSREQLREAQRLAQVGRWELVPEESMSWSSELYAILELDPEKVQGSYELFLSYVHPDDRGMVADGCRDAFSHGRTFDSVHRILMPDGRIKFVREVAEIRQEGKADRLVGAAQDITAYQQIESRMQLLSSAFHYSGEAILVSDRENRIVLVNPAFTRLTGYLPEDVMGRNPRLLSAGRTSPQEYVEMWDSIRTRGFWQGEVWDRRKDGGIYPKWMSISVVPDGEGGVRHYVANFTDISVERGAEARLHHLAHHDELTGLLNRFSLKARIDQVLAAARRTMTRFAVLFIDLDRFKVINDTLGHHIGDALLIEVARRLRAVVRDSDVVARIGGDEFVLILSSIENSGGVALVAEKLVYAIGEPCVIEGHDIYTTPSIGIAIYPTDGMDSETLMKNADAAMYYAKSAGRNNFQFFDTRMNEVALDRLHTEHGLRQALAREEFRLHFQPIIDVATGRVRTIEALIRWEHPEKGWLAPDRFISVAEESGLIQPIGDWVFWTACRLLAEIRAAGIADVRMGINISAVQMRNSNLPVLTRGALDAYGFEASGLVFEITESVAMQHPDETVDILDRLHGMGVKLALDDFGTGYSSLSYLKMFPLDELKIDRSFVSEIGENQDGQAICEATISLAHVLGLRLVAEGVETEAQFEFLKEKGCQMVQGYLFSRPLPFEQVLDFIRQRNP